MNDLRERAALLRIKECDLRMDALAQCNTSVDRGIHIGGAFSALTAMTALYYGGLMHYDVENPTDLEQDLFVLSKGHAVAALASVYADLGYIPQAALENSRGYGALIKGHPGPVIPGVPVATGPLGHGISISCGYAMRRKESGYGNVFCMVGDGELQEGSCWEGAALSADRQLANLCVLVDKNNGQSDNTKALTVSMEDVADKFRGFGYRVLEANSDEMESVILALETFVTKPQGRKPTAIICHTRKGFGGCTAIASQHKAAMTKEEVAREVYWQQALREEYVHQLRNYEPEKLDVLAKTLGLKLVRGTDGQIAACRRETPKVAVRRAGIRDKRLRYDEADLPCLEADKKYNTFFVAKQVMAALAADPRLYTIDSDLANASGLFDGTARTHTPHAINVGIAECNMMCVAEALASEGANVWTSTFAPFFDQRAMRRIAVSYQERKEAIEADSGWLAEGHNLDITFMATSSNLETAVNGATHMGNDDMNIANQMAHVKVIDVGCPQMLLSVMKWIAEGNRGLVYLRTMKTSVRPLYGPDFRFVYGKAYRIHATEKPQAVLVSSGHGIYEAMEAARHLLEQGVQVDVIDMPSFDGECCVELAHSGLPILFAEQNNGAIAEEFGKYLLRRRVSYDSRHIYMVNTRNARGDLQFIQSGTYMQLLEALHLTPQALAETVMHAISQEGVQ